MKPVARLLARRSVLIPTVALIAGMAIGGAIGAATSGRATVRTVAGPVVTKTVPGPVVTVTVHPSPSPSPSPSPVPKPKPTKVVITFDGDAGTLAVGVDIRPGTYRAVCEDDLGCYWARLGSFDNFDIKDNGNADYGQTAIVTIRASDKAFQTEGFGDWVKVKG